MFSQAHHVVCSYMRLYAPLTNLHPCPMHKIPMQVGVLLKHYVVAAAYSYTWMVLLRLLMS